MLHFRSELLTWVKVGGLAFRTDPLQGLGLEVIFRVYLGFICGLSKQLKFNCSVYFIFGSLFGFYFHYLGSISGLGEQLKFNCLVYFRGLGGDPLAGSGPLKTRGRWLHF